MWLRLSSRMVLSFLATGLFFTLGEGTSVGYARWSLWSSWAPCTRTCGGGIASRTRTCQPGYAKGHEGSSCSGTFAQHRLCNRQKCPTGNVNSSDTQCSLYNNKDIFGHRVKRWLPDDENKKNPCELRCRSEDSSLSYSFGKMANGTTCMVDGVCFRGRCTKVGCDNIVGSTATRDMCAICGGRNLSCVQVQQMYSSTHGDLHDYNRVTVIPTGATNIRVQEHTKNFLALLPGSSPQVTSVRFTPHVPGEFPLGGTVFTYSMAADHNESFFALGPTTGPLTLMTFLTVSGGQDVFYEYWIPKEFPATTPKGSEQRQRQSSRMVRSHTDGPKWTTLDNRILPLGKERPKGTTRVTTRVPLEYLVTLGTTKAPPSVTELPSRRKKLKKTQAKPRKPKPGSCPKCLRVKKQLEHYCNSDIAAHVKVLSVEPMEGGEVRYDVAVLESFRNVFTLQQREFLWSPNGTCPCPKLVVGAEYVVMAHLQQNYRRKESRLVADDKSFVRRFNDKRRRQLRRLRRRRNEKCNRTL